ncbi:Inosine/uridine-preferring nucleoside hydrolase domain-containing protein [Exophiala viscosa]|uniref:Inosine/uridine-preferring nucleoside hydrolase domain-containing protein n=1 Tax=Exophiala viscosa TaxID=2486360 RepID=A0AAN6E0V3_9EURO|nr:Inosine/uridine-preferring nucleoside hydrolase domain-containing protein [Exophiala viscosa]KAI1619526.1 Inosine/uridine-preferring nucleoside hydrolase domain-containing protein [Exophiala viscosa]
MKNIIIDTDPGVDDAVALLYALSLPKDINCLLVSLTFGNVSLRQCFCNLYTILDVAHKQGLLDGKTIPVACGQDKPLFSSETVDAAHFHGGDGLGGMHKTHAEYTPQGWEDVFSGASQPDSGKGFSILDRPADQEILHLLQSHEEDSITIVAIGPLSNVAKAAIADPQTFSRVAEVVVMGGCIDTVGNANPFAEFNTFADPEGC